MAKLTQEGDKSEKEAHSLEHLQNDWYSLHSTFSMYKVKC